uniref:Uncharacterized protein n=1 Tax=Labrus bergylta TaxID=56723 RepID=A0A3Q3KX99_9LABR
MLFKCQCVEITFDRPSLSPQHSRCSEILELWPAPAPRRVSAGVSSAGPVASPPEHSRFLCVWLFWCSLKPALEAKRLGHSGQANGFSPVCVRSCCTRWRRWTKPRLQNMQTCGFSAACRGRCRRRQLIWYGFSPRFPHTEQLRDGRENTRPHTEHG